MSDRSVSYTVIAALLVLSALVTSCGDGPGSENENGRFISPDPLVSALPGVPTIAPAGGTAGGGTQVTISGIGFQARTVVTFGGLRSQVSPSGKGITALTPPHAAGAVDVVVTYEDGQTWTLPAAYTYAFEGPQGPPPVLTAVTPSVGATTGGLAIMLRGTGFVAGATVTVGGIEASWGSRAVLIDGSLMVSTPPHSDGPVAVVVTNPDGQRATLLNAFTYAAQGSFDFNGVWAGGAGVDWEMPVAFSIRNNVVIAISCWGTPLTSFSSATVTNGEFSVLDGGMVIMTGRLKSPTEAIGTISNTICPRTTFTGDNWVAWKQSQ